MQVIQQFENGTSKKKTTTPTATTRNSNPTNLNNVARSATNTTTQKKITKKETKSNTSNTSSVHVGATAYNSNVSNLNNVARNVTDVTTQKKDNSTKATKENKASFTSENTEKPKSYADYYNQMINKESKQQVEGWKNYKEQKIAKGTEKYEAQLAEKASAFEERKKNNANYELNLYQYSDNNGNVISANDYKNQSDSIKADYEALVAKHELDNDDYAFVEGYNEIKARADKLSTYSNLNYNQTVQSQYEANNARLSEIKNEINTLNSYANNGEAVEGSNEKITALNEEYQKLSKENEELQPLVDDINTLKETGYYENLKTNGSEEELAEFNEYVSHYADNVVERLATIGVSSALSVASTAANVGTLVKDKGLEASALIAEKVSEDMKNRGVISEEDYNELLKTTNGMKSYEATDSEFRQEISDSLAQVNSYITAGVDNPVEKFVYEGVSSTSNFLTQYALFGPAGSLAVMTAQSGTDRYFELKQAVDENGNPLYTEEQCLLNGALTGLLSYATEKIGMDNFANILTGGVGKYISGHALDYIVKSVGTQGLSEGLEEVVEGLGDPIIDSMTLGTPIEYDAGEIFYAFALGAFSGGLTGTSGAINFVVNTNAQYSALKGDIALLEESKANISSNEELAEINLAIAKAQDALQAFTDSSIYKGAIEFNTQNAETNQNAESTYAKAITPNISQNLEVEQQIQSAKENINNVTNALLHQNGINMDIDQYENLSIESRESVNKVAEFAQNLGVDVSFDSTLNNAINGYNINGQIVLNPNSDTMQSAILGHEVTHNLEGSKKYAKLVELIKSTTDYQGILNDVTRAYKGVTENLESEAIAKYIEQNIANDSFIESVIKYDSSFANRVFNNIKSMFDSNEKVKIENAWMRAFENAKKNSTLNPSLQYSLADEETAPTTDVEGVTLTQEQQEYFKGVSKEALDKNGNLKRFYHTGPKGTAFSEFHPQDSNYYRFGPDTVVYVSDNADVSGSYANGNVFDVKNAQNYGDYQKRGEDVWKKLPKLEEEHINLKAEVDEYNDETIKMREKLWTQYGRDVERFSDNLENNSEFSSLATDEATPFAMYQGFYYFETLSEGDISRVKSMQDVLKTSGIENVEKYQQVKEFLEKFEKLFNDRYETQKKLSDKLSSLEKEISNLEQGKNAMRLGGYADIKKPVVVGEGPIYNEPMGWYELNQSGSNLYNRSVIETINKDIVENVYDAVGETDLTGSSKKYEIDADLLAYTSEETSDFFVENPLVLANFANILQKSLATGGDYNNFFESGVIKDGDEIYFEPDNDLKTNDVVTATLAINRYLGEQKYDSVVFKNIYDSGGVGGDNPSTVVALFNSNQFKLIGNESPTKNPDIRYSLADNTNTNDNEDANSQNTKTRYNRTNNPIDTKAQAKGDYFDYGTKPVRNTDIVRETKYGPTSQSARTIANSEYVTNETAKAMEEEALRGEYAYERVTNKGDREEAIKTIQKLGEEKSIQRVLNDNDISHMSVNIAMAEELINQLSKKGDHETEFKIRKRLAHVAAMSGQSVQAFATFKTMSPQEEIVTIESEIKRIQEGLTERWGKKAPNLTLDKTLINEYLSAENETQREEVALKIAVSIAGQIPPTVAEQLNAWRHLSMLFNPRTWTKNRISNYVWGEVSKTKQGVQTIIEGMLAEKYGGERMAGYVNTFSKEYANLKKTLDADYDANFGNFQGKYTKGDTNEIFGTSDFAKMVEENRKSFKSEFLNNLEAFNAKMMSDAPAMKNAYAFTIAGYLKTNNQTWDSLDADAKTKLREYAFNKAREVTFNAESELANAIGKFANSGKGVSGAIRKMTVDSFLPFKRTPINILKQGMKYSPMNLAKTMTWGIYQLNNGKITATQFADNLASGLTGTAIVGLGALLAYLGFLRTDDDDSDRKKYFDQGNGEQNYAIVTDIGTYTIDWLDPLIMPLAIGAELVNSDKITSVDDLIDIITAIGDPIFETSMLSGISDNLQGYEDGFAYAGGLAKNAVSNYLSQYVPTISGAVARTIDGTRRITYPNNGFIDKTVREAIAKVPGLSTLNEPYIDKQGQEEKTEDLGMGALGRAVLNFVSPGYYSSKDIDKYDEELYRLYDSTGEIDVIPSNSKKSFDYDGEKYKFTSKEYTQWNKTRMSKETELVNQFIDSDEYQYYTDEERASTIKSLRDYAGLVAKDELLENRGVDYESPEYSNIQNAVDSGVDAYKYFLTKNYYNDLKGDNVKSDYIDYLNNADMSDEAKNYMYSTQYGKSKSYGYVQDLDIGDDAKLKVYEIIADTQADKDGDGKTVSNSKAKKIKQQYEELGVYDKIVEYVNSRNNDDDEENDVSWSSFGLTKTVVGQTSKKGNTSDSDLKGSTTTKSKVSTNTLKSGKSSKTTTQNGSSSVSSGNNSSNSLNLRKFTGANTVLNSSSKGTISQNGKKLDDDYLNAYSKVFRKSLI